MSRRRSPVQHETRAKRSAREFWKRTFIWIFIFIFVFSVAGGLVAFTVTR